MCEQTSVGSAELTLYNILNGKIKGFHNVLLYVCVYSLIKTIKNVVKFKNFVILSADSPLKILHILF